MQLHTIMTLNQSFSWTVSVWARSNIKSRATVRQFDVSIMCHAEINVLGYKYIFKNATWGQYPSIHFPERLSYTELWESMKPITWTGCQPITGHNPTIPTFTHHSQFGENASQPTVHVFGGDSQSAWRKPLKQHANSMNTRWRKIC